MALVRFLFICGMIFFLHPGFVYAQSSMETRVKSLEDYVQNFQPTLMDVSSSLQKKMDKTKEDISNELQATESRVLERVQKEIQPLDTRKIVLDTTSQAFQSIQTNVGILLVSVEALRQGDKGLELVLNIGNPSYADIQGFKVRLLWGPKHYPALEDYDTWRQALQGAEYTFDGTLKKGHWNQVVIELGKVDASKLAYMECELSASSVQLQF